MSTSFKVGDHVSWNSDVGHSTGKITKVHTKDTVFMGRHRLASAEHPQYEVESAKTGKSAMHLGGALKHVRGKG